MNFNLRKNSFYKILTLNSFSIILKILMGVISTKLISIYIGLQGISLLEYFRNFTNITESISQIGLQNGISREVAISEHRKEQEQKIFSTALVISGISTFFTLLFSFVFHQSLQNYLLKSTAFETAFLLFLICLPSSVIQMIIINVLNGKQCFKKIIWINSIGYIINIVLSFILITQMNIMGAMYQMALAPLLLCIFTLVFSKKERSEIKFSFIYFDKKMAKNLLGFSLMSLLSSILAPFSLIFIRNLIETQLGKTDADIWSSIIRLSSFYMLFIGSICSLYFFPLLSKSQNRKDKKNIIQEYFIKFMPIVGVGLLLAYFLQNYIIHLLFTKDFLVLNQYFYLQLVVDFIRSCAFIFAYNLIAEKKISHFILCEAISFGGQMLLSYLLIDSGLLGIFRADILSISLYLACVYIFFISQKNKTPISSSE